MTVHKRINITLPEETIGLLDRVAPKRERSRLIDDAIRSYVADIGTANLHRKLKEGYTEHARRDLETAESWFSLDEDAWNAHR